MRIISGKYRGLNLASFTAENIRPTADRVKESLFNILSPRIYGAEVLDLFCGSGNLGIECLSRGAASVHFNDSSRQSLTVLAKNLARLKGENNYRVTCQDYLDCLKSARGAYDIIFMDPPYRAEYGLPAAEVIAARGLLKRGGIAVYERDVPFSGECPLEITDSRRYGRVYLTFLRAVED